MLYEKPERFFRPIECKNDVQRVPTARFNRLDHQVVLEATYALPLKQAGQSLSSFIRRYERPTLTHNNPRLTLRNCVGQSPGRSMG